MFLEFLSLLNCSDCPPDPLLNLHCAFREKHTADINALIINALNNLFHFPSHLNILLTVNVAGTQFYKWPGRGRKQPASSILS